MMITGFGRWLPSHIAMRFREIQGLHYDDPMENLGDGLLMYGASDDEFFEIFGMSEMMAICKELIVDRGAMARFFTAVGRALHSSRLGRHCAVEYGQFDLSEPEANTEACTIPMVRSSFSSGRHTYADLPQFIPHSGAQQDVSKVATIGVQCDLIPDHAFTFPISRALLDCEVQTDIHSQDDLSLETCSYGVSEHVVDITDGYQPAPGTPVVKQCHSNSSLPHDEGMNESYTVRS
jgi:hypothetical protein